MDRQRWQDWINLLLGLWTIAAPFFLTSLTSAGAPALPALVAWNFYIVGVAVAAIGIAALYSHRLWEEWVDVAIGVWLLVSPWALGFTEQVGLKWDAVIVGLVIALLAASALATDRQEGRPA